MRFKGELTAVAHSTVVTALTWDGWRTSARLWWPRTPRSMLLTLSSLLPVLAIAPLWATSSLVLFIYLLVCCVWLFLMWYCSDTKINGISMSDYLTAFWEKGGGDSLPSLVDTCSHFNCSVNCP